MKKHNFLAFDIGATSGRAVLATLVNGKFEMQELHRFPNNLLELHGKYYWNIYNLYEELKKGLSICAKENISLDSIGIDTWGVDFGYIAPDGSLLGLPRAYRDPYTEGALEEYFQLVPREEVYRLTGIQFMNFNSLFQLFRARKEEFAPLKNAKEILFIPDLLSYLLTGKKVCEYTDASTSQLLNPVTKQFESSLLEAAGVPPSIVRQVVMPGTLVGELTDALAEETGIGKIPVIAVAGHDTASAVAAVPAQDQNFAYLSSGTWSLMGIETEEPIITEESYKNNFTNEGGIEGTTRFLKNITGMWLLEQCRKEWEKAGRKYTYPEIVEMAEQAVPFVRFVDPDDPRFANPSCMTKAIAGYCEETGQPVPETDADFVRCIFESLALRYNEVIRMLEGMAPFPIERLHVIGGGSKNNLLNQFTANAIGMPVIAGPSEATAIGNAMIQARSAGIVSTRWEMRRLIAQSIGTETFLPQDEKNWKEVYGRYKKIVKR
ncbi:rhamnulokinase [Parabacteroides sp. AF18-52]|jgi:rhamnulose kinase/L-fuculose kinase|uniref:rhamnulokinase n=1 Tax=Parabacteroides TaxID=375288 RepID=UPI000EFEEE6A|nr:rhamnulokinase family protein [Parabacteroides sp. AF18-52]RHR42959.1 rhamnulokinase [Parabacteroides sp. AF18-52]